MLPPRPLRPMRLSRRVKPFDSDRFIFELKIDGWRALALVHDGKCDLVSRNGNVFRGFDLLRADLASRLPDGTVLDGEICCLDERGRSVFNDLMFKRNENGCFFYAFDLLFLAGDDLRNFPLI